MEIVKFDGSTAGRADVSAAGLELIAGDNAAAQRASLGSPLITVGTTEPTSPATGDLWGDTN